MMYRSQRCSTFKICSDPRDRRSALVVREVRYDETYSLVYLSKYRAICATTWVSCAQNRIQNFGLTFLLKTLFRSFM